MRQECVDSISAVKGTPITSAEGDRMVHDVLAEMRRLGQKDPGKWAVMSFDERARAAAASLAAKEKDAAARKVANMNRQVLRQDELIREMNRLAADEDVHAFSAVARVLLGVERRAKGVTNEYMTRMLDTVNGIGSKWLGFVEDAADVRDFAREVFGEKTGNGRAAKAAKAWLEAVESLRQRALNAGAEIGELDYGYIPQSHDWWKLRQAGEKQWVEEILPLLDRKRLTDDFGDPLDDDAARRVLSKIFNTIVTGGNDYHGLFDMADRIKPPPAGVPNRTPRFVWDRRVLHFKDADSFLAYESKYGKGSITEAMHRHVTRAAGDIALLETMGPKAGASFEWLKRIAEADAMNARKTESRTRLLMKYSDWQGFTGVHIDDIWANLTGAADHTAPNHEGVAAFMSGWRSLEAAGKPFIPCFPDNLHVLFLLLSATAQFSGRLPVMSLHALADLIRRKGSVVIDGAMSTALEKQGCNLNDPLWTARILIDEPEKILQVHRDYYASGANIATTCSYQATDSDFARRGFDRDGSRRLVTLTVELARQARDEYLSAHPETPVSDLLIAGSVGPYGAHLADGSEYTGTYSLSAEEYRSFHRLRLETLVSAGADFIALETQPRLEEVQSFLNLLKEFDTSAWVTFTLKDEGHLPDGTPIEEAAELCAADFQVDAMGINCVRRELVDGALSRMSAISDKPLVVYPNSGEIYDPKTKTWSNPPAFSGWSDCIGRWHRLGALCLGGCCRTLPADIREISELVRKFSH